MKLIIAGSRTLTASVDEIDALIQHYNLSPTEIVSGTAKGIDQCGETYAHHKGIAVAEFPAEWDEHGKSAGYRRNVQMGQYADVLLLIWDGQSKGSQMMKSIMEKLNKPIYEAVAKHIPVLVNNPNIKTSQDMATMPALTIKDKVEYVRSQGQTRKHHCHWPGCDKDVPPAMWGCKNHWFRLPKNLRDRVWATYKPGQEINGTPSRAYLLVADQVQQWIKENS